MAAMYKVLMYHNTIFYVNLNYMYVYVYAHMYVYIIICIFVSVLGDDGSRSPDMPRDMVTTRK